MPFFDDQNQPVFRDGAGVVYGFGTDTRYHLRETLKQELKSLFLVFSEQDSCAS